MIWTYFWDGPELITTWSNLRSLILFSGFLAHLHDKFYHFLIVQDWFTKMIRVWIAPSANIDCPIGQACVYFHNEHMCDVYNKILSIYNYCIGHLHIMQRVGFPKCMWFCLVPSVRTRFNATLLSRLKSSVDHMNGRLYMYMYHQSDLWRTNPLTVFNDFIFIHMYIIQMPKLFENDVVKFQHNAKGSSLYRGFTEDHDDIAQWSNPKLFNSSGSNCD